MCKILTIAGITDETRPNAIKFIKKMAEEMTPGNTDGLGYAAVDKDGKLFAERWLYNREAFKSLTTEDLDTKVVRNFLKGLKNGKVNKVYSRHGEPDLNKTVAITLHARFATTEKGIANTHPFIDADTSVIHNGVIANTEDFDFKLSTCDSESILISYLKYLTGSYPENIRAAASDLVGYYACGVFGRDKDGKRILDVFKGNNDNLVVSYVEELKTFVMSTSERDIKSACDSLGFKMGTAYSLDDGMLWRIDPLTGQVMLDQDFTVGPRYVYAGTTKPAYNGAKTYDANTNVLTPETSNVTKLPATAAKSNKNLTNDEIEYLKLVPALSELTYVEKMDYYSAAGNQ